MIGQKHLRLCESRLKEALNKIGYATDFDTLGKFKTADQALYLAESCILDALADIRDAMKSRKVKK